MPPKPAATTQASVRAAEASVQGAKSGLESARAGIQSVEATVAAKEREIDRLTITAPFEGLLETDTAEFGSLMQTNGPLADIAPQSFNSIQSSLWGTCRKPTSIK